MNVRVGKFMVEDLNRKSQRGAASFIQLFNHKLFNSSTIDNT